MAGWGRLASSMAVAQQRGFGCKRQSSKVREEASTSETKEERECGPAGF